MNRFLETAKGSSYHTLFYAALFTNMGRSELLGLRWSNVDLVLGQVSVECGLHYLKDGSYVFTETNLARSRRTIALSPSVTQLLRHH